jgi:hypothetical protein
MLSRPLPSSPPRVLRRLASEGQRLAFWAAVVLPLAYVPLLSSSVDDRQLLAVGALVAIHVVCLLVGHDYSPRQ